MERNALVLAIHWPLRTALGAALGLVLALLFGDALTLRAGSRVRELDDLRLPLRALALLAGLYAVIHRGALASFAGRVARGRANEGDRELGRAALVGLIAVGFLLRIARIHEYAYSPDEAQFIWYAAAESLADVWRFEQTMSPHPPAIFLALHLLERLTWDPFWLRLPSVLAGTFTIWMTHRFARELFGPAAALSAAVLVTFAPPLVDLSRVCRNYAPGFAFLLVAVHLLAGFLRTEDWRRFAGFALLAPLAVTWHYGFVAAFAGLELVVAGVLLTRRRPLGCWIRAAVYQLPFLAVLTFLYLEHIRIIDRRLWHFLRWNYRDILALSPGRLLDPLLEVWRYLVHEPFAALLCGLALFAVPVLLLQRRFLELSICAAPVAAAYLLMAGNLMPLGGTRHSSYLFPFLFVLAASQVPELLDGYRRTGARLRELTARRGWPFGTSRKGHTVGERPWRPLAGLVVAGAAGALFVDASLATYGRGAAYARFELGRPPHELLTYYRVEDAERAFALLEERAGENDLVLLGFQGLYALRLHLRVTPLLEPTPEQQAQRDIRLAFPGEGPLQRVHNGVRYYYSGRVTAEPTPQSLLHGLDDVRESFRLPAPDRVWAMRSGWEQPLPPRLAAEHPEVVFDREVAAASKDMLLAIDADALARLGSELERRPGRRGG